MCTGEFNAGDNLAMDYHPIQGDASHIQGDASHATETGLSSGLVGHLPRMQTLRFYLFTVYVHGKKTNHLAGEVS